MNTGALLLGGAASFWGWQTGQWLLALCAALALEAPRVVKKRWDFELQDFQRVADLCGVLVLALFVYLYFAFGNPRAVVLLFQWLPLAVLPLVLMQAWSSSAEIPLGVVFRSLRSRPQGRTHSINLGYPALVLWLLGASAANSEGAGFYFGLTAIAAWALALNRPRSAHPALWALGFAAAAGIGFAGQAGLYRTQQWLEGVAGEGTRTDPYRSMTGIGEIGEIKLSDSIVLRLEADPAASAPILLHRASYDTYAAGTWIAAARAFAPVVRDPGETEWTLERAVPQAEFTIHDSARDDHPVLSLPAGTVRVGVPGAAELRRNPLGTVQIRHAPGYLRYVARIAPDAKLENPPALQDLRLPAAEAALVRSITERLGLARLPPEQALQVLRRYFVEEFSYSLYREGSRAPRETVLSQFLQTTRSGHCEYFATAAVLLARAAGIPARYATGFSAMEYSSFEKAYLVRNRHAHAWARVYIDGAWRDFDATPPIWADIEAANASGLTGLRDAFAWLGFTFSRWAAADKRFAYEAAGWAAALAGLWFIGRVIRRRRASVPTEEQAAARRSWPGADSEFYRVEQRIAELGWKRESSETLQDWLGRIGAAPQLEPQSLEHLASLHYRYRFDPLGLDEAGRTSLREASIGWLARHPKA